MRTGLVSPPDHRSPTTVRWELVVRVRVPVVAPPGTPAARARGLAAAPRSEPGAPERSGPGGAARTRRGGPSRGGASPARVCPRRPSLPRWQSPRRRRRPARWRRTQCSPRRSSPRRPRPASPARRHHCGRRTRRQSAPAVPRQRLPAAPGQGRAARRYAPGWRRRTPRIRRIRAGGPGPAGCGASVHPHQSIELVACSGACDSSTAGRRRRSIEMDSLWAIRNSHGRMGASR